MAFLEARENPLVVTVRIPLDFLADGFLLLGAGCPLLYHRTVLKHEHHLLKTLNSEDSSNWLNGLKYFDKASFMVHMVGKEALY